MTANSTLKTFAFTPLRAVAGLLGFTCLIFVEFAKCVFNIAFSIDSPAIAATPTVTPVDLVKPDALTVAVEDLDKFGAIAHFQMHSGPIRDAETRAIQLSLFVGKSPRIERILRLPADKLDFQRINWRFDRIPLPAFTPEIAAAAGLPFNFDGAKKFSLPEFSDKSIALRQAARVLPPAEIFSVMKKVNAQAEGHGQPEGPVAAQNSHSEAEGVVMSAGSVLVSPEGRQAYKAFAVVIHTTTGDVTFQGVDLEEKFKKYQFSIRDRISIKKATTKFEIAKPHGKSESRSKNTFEIKVLEKALA